MYKNSLCSRRRLIHDKDDDKENEKATSPAAESDKDNDEVPVEAYLKEIREIEKGIERSAEDQKAIETADMSRAHQQRCQTTEVAFVTVLSEIHK